MPRGRSFNTSNTVFSANSKIKCNFSFLRKVSIKWTIFLWLTIFKNFTSLKEIFLIVLSLSDSRNFLIATMYSNLTNAKKLNSEFWKLTYLVGFLVPRFEDNAVRARSNHAKNIKLSHPLSYPSLMLSFLFFDQFQFFIPPQSDFNNKSLSQFSIRKIELENNR